MLTETMFTQALRETQEQMGTTEWEWPEVRIIDDLSFMKKRKVLKNCAPNTNIKELIAIIFGRRNKQIESGIIIGKNEIYIGKNYFDSGYEHILYSNIVDARLMGQVDSGHIYIKEINRIMRLDVSEGYEEFISVLINTLSKAVFDDVLNDESFREQLIRMVQFAEEKGEGQLVSCVFLAVKLYEERTIDICPLKDWEEDVPYYQKITDELQDYGLKVYKDKKWNTAIFLSNLLLEQLSENRDFSRNRNKTAEELYAGWDD